MFNKEKEIKAGDIEVISRNLTAEVPYELVAMYDANGNKRLFTRNIRDAKSEAEQKENIVKLKEKEVEIAKKEAEVAKQKVSKSKPVLEE